MKRYYYQGEMRTVKEIATIARMDYRLLINRLYMGYPVEEAVTDNPLRESVKGFFDASMWEDWVDKSTDEVYTVYWRWCIKESFDPESKLAFVKSMKNVYPWLTVKPSNGVRFIREKEV